jgi:hypothetical protein
MHLLVAMILTLVMVAPVEVMMLVTLLVATHVLFLTAQSDCLITVTV